MRIVVLVIVLLTAFAPAAGAKVQEPPGFDLARAFAYLHARDDPLVGCFGGMPEDGCVGGAPLRLLNTSSHGDLRNEFWLNDNLIAISALRLSGHDEDRRLMGALSASVEDLSRRIGLPVTPVEGVGVIPVLGRHEIFLTGGLPDFPYSDPAKYVLNAQGNPYGIAFTPHNAQVFIDVAQNRSEPRPGGGWQSRVNLTEHLDYRGFADLLVYRALSLSPSFPAQAIEHIRAAAALWDGQGILDVPALQPKAGEWGLYQTYKAALVLYGATELERELGAPAALDATVPRWPEMVDALAAVQVADGGLVTAYVGNGLPAAVTNTETTAISILALSALVDRVPARGDDAFLAGFPLADLALGTVLLVSVANGFLLVVLVRRTRGPGDRRTLATTPREPPRVPRVESPRR